MYSTHPNCVDPSNEDIKIWRFIDFPKFVSMLHNNSLFFASVEQMGDPFEGTFSDYTLTKTKKDFQNRGVDLSILKHNFVDLPKLFSKIAYLNCWHMNEHEPSFMWKNYTLGNQGIAIQSTFKKLKESFSKTPESIHISQIKYIDYKTAEMIWGNMIETLIHKRINFSDEREIRSILIMPPVKEGKFDENHIPKGHHILVDLDILIESVTVAPTAPEWIYELCVSMLEKFDIKKPVFKSNLDEKPASV